jgi:pilus assembly protein Flp/PilA
MSRRRANNCVLISLNKLQQRSCIMGSAAQGATMGILIGKFLRNECGATAIEYALIAAGISIAIVAAVGSLGTTLNATYTSVSTALK